MEGRVLYLLLLLPGLVAAFTVHEFAHAWAGNRLGDDTARRQGRLTLDPLAHLDPFGTLMIVLAIFSGLPLLGWARPVPFNPRNLSNPRRDGMLIAVAGPISNLIQAAVWFFLLVIFRWGAQRAGVVFDIQMIEGVLNRRPDVNSLASVGAAIMAAGIAINIGLAAFNMIPIPPLDGHYVLEGLGPPAVTTFFNTIRPFSWILLFLLIQTPLFREALMPAQRFADGMILRAFGLSPSDFSYF